MFQRDVVKIFLDAEIDRFKVEQLPWEGITLIDDADQFIPFDKHEHGMISRWCKDGYLQVSGDSTYQWSETSQVPRNLKRETHIERPGTKAGDTYEARLARFFNKVSVKFHFDTTHSNIAQITELCWSYKAIVLHENVTKHSMLHSQRWHAFDRKFIGGRKPDIILTSQGVDQNVGWAQVYSAVEVKYKDSRELRKEAFSQLADTATLVLYHQMDCQWFPCLSLLGTNLYLHVFTRGGSLRSVPLDIEKDIVLFTKVLNYFTQQQETNAEMLGYDTRSSWEHTFWWPGNSTPGAEYTLVGKLFVSGGAYPPHIECCVRLTNLISRSLQ